ncbi:MAG: M20/M25/M40 family metallo-hydrolase, partial [Planctomycetota bacterium]
MTASLEQPLTEQLVARVAGLEDELAPLREEILATLVTLGQIPAPGGGEEARGRYLLDRLTEQGVTAGYDDFGNAVGFVPGKNPDKTILAVAHLDTIVPDNVDHDLTITADRVTGPGVSDNALGAAVVAMLPACLERLDVKLEHNLQLLGSVRSLNRGNHGGIRDFLDHAPRPFDYGVSVEGVHLGRLNFFSIGTIRGDIHCHVRPIESRSYGAESAIAVLNYIINRILRIEVPTRPFTKIRLAQVFAGISYDDEPENAMLGFEVNSHSDQMIERVERQIADIVAEITARHAVSADLDVFFRRQAGGLPFAHPLVKATLAVMETVGVEPDQGHSPSDLSEFIARGIPAVTLGVSRGNKNRREPDYVEIDPILKGVAQVVGTLLAIDSG